jgi:hypothetical protein
MPPKAPDPISATGNPVNRTIKSGRPRLIKWTITIMVAFSMIGKPQLKDWGNASILYYNHPSLYNSIDVFFTTVTLLYYMILGGYAAWASLSSLQSQGRKQKGTICAF